MKIGIVGEIDSSGGGFSDSMSLSQAHGFSANECEVVLVSNYFSRLVNDFDPELRLLRSIGTKLVNSNSALRELISCDWVIWNSYRIADNDLLTELRSKVRLTKSFPRLFGTQKEENRILLDHRLQYFDFVALALKQDFDAAVDSEFDVSQVGYVPRGFISDWLATQVEPSNTSGYKICVDGPVRPKNVSGSWAAEEVMSNLDEALYRVCQERQVSEVISSRVKLKRVNSTRLGKLPTNSFYKLFFCGANLYLGSPLSNSRHSEARFVGDSYRGLYENQIIEAQIAGAMVLGEAYSIHSELRAPNQSSELLDFSNIDQMIELILDCLDKSKEEKENISTWARVKHDSIIAMGVWKKFLESL